MISIEIRKLLAEVVVFMNWQAEGTTLAVTWEPVPEDLPVDILADFKWLREDLMCVAANALKFSQERSMVPVIVRVTIGANDDVSYLENNNVDDKMIYFSFIDSGRKLSNDRYSTIFDHPKMLSNERLGMGGMGLGLYCLRERVTAMGGQSGARARRDGLEGTEVWFCIPLLQAMTNINSVEVQHHTGLQLQVVDEHTPALEKPSIRMPNETIFVTALGGPRRFSTISLYGRSSSRRNSAFVHIQTNPPNRGVINGMDNNGAGIHLSNEGVYSALISRKSSKPQSWTESVREFADASPIMSRRPSLDQDASNTLISNTITYPLPSVKSLTESSRKSIDASPIMSRRPSFDQVASNALISNGTTSPQPSAKSFIESERKSIDASPIMSRRPSLDQGANNALISSEIPYPQPSVKSLTESERKSIDASPFISRRPSLDHLREESHKSLDRVESRKAIDASLIASLKPSQDQLNEDTGQGALPILIVDDSITILKMIKRSILNKIPDLIVKEARNGLEALERVHDETNGFHVIITDIQMPECNGFDFTRRVREFESRNHLLPTMIVGMSANCQAKFVTESQLCGMDGFIQKPFDLQTLLDVINHVQLHRDVTNQMDPLHSTSVRPQVIDHVSFITTLSSSNSLFYSLIHCFHWPTLRIITTKYPSF